MPAAMMKVVCTTAGAPDRRRKFRRIALSNVFYFDDGAETPK